MPETRSPLIGQMEAAFASLNAALFAGRLQPVAFVVQTKRKASLRWVPDAETIVIGSEFPRLNYSEVAEVLLHEMVHVANHQRGVPDVTTNQYHNKQFLLTALEVGLVVVKHKTQGWAITTTAPPRNVIDRSFLKRPSKEAVEKRQSAFAALGLEQAVFQTGRAGVRDRVKAEKPSKTYFLKYQCECPPPHNSVRSGRRPDGLNALNIRCLNCGSLFRCVSKLDG